MWRSPFMPIVEWAEWAWPYTMTSEYYQSIWIPSLAMIVLGFVILSVKEKTAAFEAFGAILLVTGFGLFGGPLTFLGLIFIVGIPLMIVEAIFMLFDPNGRESLLSLVCLIFLTVAALGGGGGSWIIAIFVRRR